MRLAISCNFITISVHVQDQFAGAMLILGGIGDYRVKINYEGPTTHLAPFAP